MGINLLDEKIIILVIFINFSICSKVDSTIPEDIEAGKKIYEKNCQYCHGITGKGDGHAADFLNPKPRDFTAGLYKIRSTPSGELPTDEDIFNVITKGMPGTSMPEWSNISEKQRWQIVSYIKTFSERFAKEKPPQQISSGKEPTFNSQSIEKGKKIYKRIKCFLCHGDEGKSDGVITTTLWNEWRIPFYARNFTKAWTFKGGNTTNDIYRTISTGMNGTPMGSYEEHLTSEERWNLSHYIKSISKEEIFKVILKSKFVNGSIPYGADDPYWESSDYMTVPLTGQITVSPRWQNSSIDSITIKSFYNEKEIVFLFEWDDRTENTLIKETINNINFDTSFPKIILQPQDEVLSDAVAIQFPLKAPEGQKKPHFILGDSENPVNLWKWSADSKETKEIIASGFNSSIYIQDLEKQNVEVKSIYNNGKWKVLMKRNLRTDDDQDITFEKGKLIPFLIYIWDGSNNEKDLRSSISSWYYLVLEPSTPVKVYVYPSLAFILAIYVEFLIIRRIRRKK